MVIKDRQRRTALFYAQKNNHRELAALLKAAVAASGTITPTRQLSQTEADMSITIDSEVQPDGVSVSVVLA